MPVSRPMKYFPEVFEHISDNVISNESSKIIGYRYDATGVFGYVFLCNKKYRITIFEFKY